MGGRFFEGFNILFLAARREQRADMSSGTTTPLWRSGTHNAASPFAVSAVGMRRGSLILQLEPPGGWQRTLLGAFLHFYSTLRKTNSKDGRPFLAIKWKWKRKSLPFFHFLCAIFIYSSIFPFITLATKTSLNVFFYLFPFKPVNHLPPVTIPMLNHFSLLWLIAQSQNFFFFNNFCFWGDLINYSKTSTISLTVIKRKWISENFSLWKNDASLFI